MPAHHAVLPPAGPIEDSATPTRRATRLLMLGAVLVGLLDTAQYQLGAELRGGAGPLGLAIGAQLLPWVWLAALLPGVVWLAHRFPVDPERWRRSLGPHLAGMVGFALLQIAGTVALGVWFADGPVVVRFFATKVLLFRFPIDALAYWGAVGVVEAARATTRARERERQAVRLEASLSEARLAALRDRLHPHFVFNTLNAVSTLALRNDQAGVIHTIEALGDLLRSLLAEDRPEEVSLAEELALLDRYLEIERLRYGERLTLARDVDPAVLDARVPVMLIQPLVENAIRHGAGRCPGPARVDLRAARDDGALVLEVADTGPGFRAAGPRWGVGLQAGTGIGLASSRARLRGLYGDDGVLTCGDRPEGGGLVRVRLPLRWSRPSEEPGRPPDRPAPAGAGSR